MWQGLEGHLNVVMGIGWLATGLVVLSALMPTMIPLRSIGAVGNLVSLVFGVLLGSWPTIVQHTFLLPLNLYRLAQMRKLIRDTQGAAESGLKPDWLVPFSKAEPRNAGEVIFRKGDRGDRLYFLRTGQVRFEEIGVEISSGSLFGEVAFFLDDGRRTQTAVCVTDCDLLAISETKLKQLYFQNPKFGWFLVRLIAQRLSENIARVQAAVPNEEQSPSAPVDRELSGKGRPHFQDRPPSLVHR